MKMDRDKLISYAVLVIIVLGILFLLSKRAEAGTADVTWTHPTTRVNGTALPVGQIASTRIEYSLSSTFATLAGTQTVTAPATSVTVTGLTDGATYCFRAFTQAVDGSVSVASVSQPCKSVPISPPNPPVLSTVVTTAFELQSAYPGYRLVEVGTVPMGVACGANWAQDPKFARLSYADVIFTRKYRRGVLMTVCG